MEIGFFIEPENFLNKKIIFWKKKFTNKFSIQKYIFHPPHLTLCTMQISKNFLYFLKQNKNLSIKTYKSKLIKININRCDYFKNDPITKSFTLFYSVNRNIDLQKIQKTILNKFLKFKLNKIKKNIFLNKNLKNSYEKYTYPFTGKNFLPHFTIASFNASLNNPLIQDFLNQKINYTQNINIVSIWIIKNDYHKKIGEISIL